MEFILDLVKPESLPSQVLCLIVLLIVSLKDVKLSQNLKVSVLYLASFIMTLTGLVEVWLGIVFLMVASFIVLEIFTDDPDKKTLFSFIYKLIDCFYKLIFEYYLCLYLLSILVLFLGNNIVISCQNHTLGSHLLSGICADTSIISIWVIIIASVLIISSLLCITRMKFETRNITSIMYELNPGSIYYVPIETMRTKFTMLVAFEDKTFFSRAENSHTVFSPIIVKSSLRYITAHHFLHPFRMLRKIFSRGYGTIEMQLIRSVGVLHGYDQCKIRRKFFEVIYSTLIFNSYCECFAEYNGNSNQYRAWILWRYIQKVPVRFKRRFFPTDNSTTSQQVFGKRFEDLTLEEFFVWCLSLEFFAIIGPKTVNRREDIITKYSLKRGDIDNALVRTYGME